MRRILLVDDEPAILFAVSSFLTTPESEVDTAEDVSTAKSLIASRRYDVVLTDLRLGRQDRTGGLQIVSTVREQQPDAKTILLTAYGSAEVEAQAIALGVDRYEVKPIDLRLLARIIAGLLEPAGETS